MTWVAGIVVVASGLALVAFAALIWIAPVRAADRFLASFASSAHTHYTEQSLRLIAGVGFIIFAPELRFPDLFRMFGWLLALTATGLLLIPWQWHHRFGKWAIPLAITYKRPLGFAVLALGLFVLCSVF